MSNCPLSDPKTPLAPDLPELPAIGRDHSKMSQVTRPYMNMFLAGVIWKIFNNCSTFKAFPFWDPSFEIEPNEKTNLCYEICTSISV